ncbi:DUF2177 family protein [bacterium]|nr:DUF2177 family protein [bacterium]
MSRRIVLYLVMLATFLIIDAIWLGAVAAGFYRTHLGYLLAPEPVWLAAGVFYLLFVLGIQVFVVLPGLRSARLRPTVLRAAFFGLVTYATYDLTNLATIDGWPLVVTLVDLAWGMAISTAVALAGLAVGRRWTARDRALDRPS